MKLFSFFIEPDMLKKIKREVAVKGYDSMASFLRKLINDYFKNK